MTRTDTTYEGLVAAADESLRNGNVGAAEDVLASLAERYPERPGGMIGLARVAQLRGDWQAALRYWDGSLARYAAGAPAEIEAERAWALLQAGRVDEAFEEGARLLLAGGNDSLAAVNLLWMVAEKTKRFADLKAHLATLEQRRPGSKNALMLRARSSAYLHEPRLANRAVAELMARDLSLDELQFLFSVLVQTHEEAHLGMALRHLLGKLRGLEATADPELIAVFTAQLHLAMREPGAAEKALAGLKRQSNNPLVTMMADMLARWRAPSYPDYTAPKIFCIGLSKTGTSSLHQALNMLGYRSVHWRIPATGKLIDRSDYFLFDAFSDTSVCYNFEYLYYAFPNARFIYTERPVESWSRSFLKHFRELGETFEEMKENMRRHKYKKYGVDWDIVHRTLYFNQDSPEDAYAAFDERVRLFFSDKPPDRLLSMNIFAGDGWEKLCGYLDRAVPAGPFPHSNKTI